MRIAATRIDPGTGEPDPYGIPQIDCPARREDVNPQFTCQSCPCAGELGTHEAVDDRGSPYYLVDLVDCRFEETEKRLPAQWQRFPSLLVGMVENPPPRVEPGVECPLLESPDRMAPLVLEIDGRRWVPVGNCRSCQFYRGIEGSLEEFSPEAKSGIFLICAAPICRRLEGGEPSTQ